MLLAFSPVAAAHAEDRGGIGWSLGLWSDPDPVDRFKGMAARPDRAEGSVEVAQADCSAAAAQAAAETGGQVLSVSSRDEGGQTVCVVTLLVPGQDGERPRKTTITVRP